MSAEPARSSGTSTSRQRWLGWWFEAGNQDAIATLLTMPEADVDAALPAGHACVHEGLRGPEPGVQGATALMLACRRGDAGSVGVLIAAGAKLDGRRDANGCTPLHYAAAYGSLPCAEALIAAGADLDAQDLQGSTPAIIAAFAGSGAVLSALVGSGCDLSLADEGNVTVAGHLRNLRMAPQLAEVLAAAGPGGAAKPVRGSKHYRALRKQLEAAKGPERRRATARRGGLGAWRPARRGFAGLRRR